MSTKDEVTTVGPNGQQTDVSRRSHADGIFDELKNILGASAFSNSFKVPNDISRMSHTILYLVTQISIVKKDVDDDDTKEYIDILLKNAHELLTKNGG